jgi:hypothetical protein
MSAVLKNVCNTHEVTSQMCTVTYHDGTKEAISAQEISAVKLRLLASRGGSEEGQNTKILE